MNGPLRILLIAHFFPPSGETGANRPGAFARHLRAAGHRVTVLTSAAYGSLPEDDAVGNVRTYDLQLLQAKLAGRRRASDAASSDTFSTKAHPLSRILVPDAHMAAWMPFGRARGMRLARGGHFDCALTTSPPESVHFIGRALAARGLPWVADLRDGWAFEPAVKEDLWPSQAQHRLNEWMERRVLSRASGVTAVTSTVVDDLRDRLGIGADLVPNGWEPEPGLLEEAEVPELDPDRVSVIYTGRLAGGKKDPAPVIAALARLAEKDPESAGRLELVFAGSFTEEEQRLLATDCSPARLVNAGRLDPLQTAALQARADAALLITSAERRQESGSKLFEYIGAGLPVVALARPDSAAAEIVGDANGLVVGTHDTEAIAGALRDLAGRRVGRPAEVTRRGYSWPALTERLVAALRAAIARS